jgi:FKBP-type peptidyl-prolyl cis-trans isomerase FklB
MKKTILLALALVASASLFTATAQKKKVATKKGAVKEEPVKLSNGSDSLSYAAGMSITNGLIPFLVQQQGVDTTYMADFVKGFQMVANGGSDPKMKAYAAGMDIAKQVKERMMPDLTKDFQDTPDSIVTKLFYKGFSDALLKDSSVFKQEGAEAYFRDKQIANKAAKDEKLYGANRDAGRQFLAENAKKEGVVTLPSGLQYKVLVKGDGPIPTLDDKVQVNYEGRLVDGTMFDASAKHGDKPMEFKPSQVIKGWQEALTMMPVGSTWQLFIPFELAYGDRDSGQIKPFSALVFDVQLVGIVK